MSQFSHRVGRILKKPLRVISFKLRQEAQISFLQHTRGWQRIEKGVRDWWTDERVKVFAARHARALIAEDAEKGFEKAFTAGLINRQELVDFGLQNLKRRFELFGTPVPREGTWPWYEDWRFSKVWEPTFFKNYYFYSKEREKPYDIKLPWELSRLSFILPILQAATLQDSEEWADSAVKIIEDWEARNPLAYSVAWFPMEASMRAINLAFASDMLLVSGEIKPRRLSSLLRLLSLHGEFVWRTREYTDVRGNHYAANIVALLVLGALLREIYPGASKWLQFAASAVGEEILNQFLPDGVNFEKSISYHRLVTELFLLAMICLEKQGMSLPAVCQERLRAASDYSAACVRPDGLTPNVGDNDDARVFGFDPLPVRDHCPMIGLAAAWWHDPRLKRAAGGLPSALVWLLGEKGIDAWQELPFGPDSSFKHFNDGGVVVARDNGQFLWVDVGEVGMAGRGGHGHNDLLSFEVVLRGQPLIIDPGSYVYTADQEARNLFRSTFYHNALRVDGQEMAPMGGMWEIGNDALPQDVEVSKENGMVKIKASHSGYMRLQDKVLHIREIKFQPGEEVLTVIDYLQCRESHTVDRMLHLDPSVDATQEDACVILSVGGLSWGLRWSEGTEVRLEQGWVSPGYGVKIESTIVVLSNHLKGDTELSFKIHPGKGDT